MYAFVSIIPISIRLKYDVLIAPICAMKIKLIKCEINGVRKRSNSSIFDISERSRLPIQLKLYLIKVLNTKLKVLSEHLISELKAGQIEKLENIYAMSCLAVSQANCK